MTDGWARALTRTNPYAGPEEVRLAKVLQANLMEIAEAQNAWRTGRDNLADLERRLKDQQQTILDGYDADAGRLAANGYQQIRDGLQKRADEMERMGNALDDTRVALSAAQEKYRHLPQVSPPSSESVTGMPTANVEQRQAVADKQAEINAVNKQHEADYLEAERQARQAMNEMQEAMDAAAEKMRPVAGLERPAPVSNGATTTAAGTGPQYIPTSGTGSPNATGTGYTPIGGLSPTDDGPGGDGDGTGDPGDDPTPTTPPPYVPPGCDPLPPTGGELAGGTTPTAPTPGVIGGGDSTSGSGVGSGAAAGAGVAAAGGLGALGGARAAGTGIRATGVPGSGTPARLGGSASSASRGALGRPAAVAGQQGAAGRTGAGSSTRGASTGRTGAAGARGLVGGQSSGTGRGAAGGRAAGAAGGRPAAGGSTAAKRGAGSGAARGVGATGAAAGRGGRKRQDDDQAVESRYLEAPDEWIDDDGAGPQTLD